MQIEVKQLNKRYKNYEACKNVDFMIEQGKLIGLLGPSGGGKTTILRMLAGLEMPDAGEIYFNGQLVNDVPPQKRGIGFVFQNYALFKHMSVYDNIAFGLTIQRKQKGEIRDRVMELLALIGLEGVEHRYPHQLSGGQRQRVAFARALAPQPQLLLLDEPFAAIDAKVRKELRIWLRDMIQRVGVTTIFVTHDQEEAVEVADEIMIIHQGRLEQQGSPIDIYHQPKTPFVAGFIGESSIIRHPAAFKSFDRLAADATALVRPEFLEIGSDRELSRPFAAEQGVVKDVVFRGNRWQIEVEIGSERLFGYRSLEQRSLQLGEEVLVLIHRLYVYEGKRLVAVENALKDDPMPVFI